VRTPKQTEEALKKVARETEERDRIQKKMIIQERMKHLGFKEETLKYFGFEAEDCDNCGKFNVVNHSVYCYQCVSCGSEYTDLTPLDISVDEKPKKAKGYQYIDDKGNRMKIMSADPFEANKIGTEATKEQNEWLRTHTTTGGDCPMCGNSMFPLKRELPFEDECNKCNYGFTFVYKKINLGKDDWGNTQYEDGIKPTRPKPPRATVKSTGREPIPQDVIDAVWNRDGGQCVKCNSNQDLEYDHIIPLSKGGSNRYRNLQLLCVKCNRSKSDNIG